MLKIVTHYTFLVLHSVLHNTTKAEQHLIEDLLSNYEPGARTIFDSTQPMIVLFDIAFYKLIQLVSEIYYLFFLYTVIHKTVYRYTRIS